MKNSDTYKAFQERIDCAGYAELKALEKRVDLHYELGTLTVSEYRKLDTRIFKEVARFDCLTPNTASE